MRKAGSKATPWSVKGIDDATRDVAREAAQEAGLTLGAWIDRAILRHAGITPIPANDEAGSDAGTEADADQLETEVAAAEGRIEGHLRPVGLAVARIAQRMVQLERGLKSLPPDWPSTLTVAAPASAPGAGKPPMGEDHVAGGMADGTPEDEPEDEIVFPAVAAGAKPDFAEEDWDARWDQFKTELAAESTDDGRPAADPTEEEEAPPPAPASTVSTVPQTRVRRHIPGKLIVGGLVLIIGVGSGIALMSQSERLGVKPALQRTADAVIGLGEDIQTALRNGTRWVEDRAWQLRGGRDGAESSSAVPESRAEPPAKGPTASGPAAVEAAPPAVSQRPIQGTPQEEAKPGPSSAGTSSDGTSSPNAPLPVPPTAAPEPTASGDARVAPGPSVAALPDAKVQDSKAQDKARGAETKPAAGAPKTSTPGFAGLVEQRARQGDPEAQHDLAVLYATGDGRPQDMREAAYWFREAAIQGVPGAQYNLGVLYEKGTGVQQDDVRALLWYHSAAERNHPRAQYNLGLFYAQGRGIPVNYAEARKWLRRAGDQGMTPALFELGQMEERGLGDAPDRGKARALYAQAAALGDQAAAERLVAMPLDNSTPPASSPASAAKGEAAAATPSPLSPEAERETIRAIQHILIRLGYEVGAADGLLGDRTREGIRDYQRRHDLPVNGTPSALLLQHMLQVMSKDPAAGPPPANPTAARSSVR